MSMNVLSDDVVIINKKELENKMSKVYNMLELLDALIEDRCLTATDVFGESETEDNDIHKQSGYMTTKEFMDYFKEFGIDVE